MLAKSGIVRRVLAGFLVGSVGGWAGVSEVVLIGWWVGGGGGGEGKRNRGAGGRDDVR